MLQKHLKNCFRLIRKSTKKFRKFFEKIQLTCLYFLSTSILMYSIKNALGFFPSIFLKLIPFSGQILNCELLKLLANPERTFIFYLLALEFIVNRPTLNFSILFKFNLLLIFILEMLQNLVLAYWVLLVTRELDIFGDVIIARGPTIYFFEVYFTFFFLFYLYCYIMAMRGLFPRIPGILQGIFESVAFWLQLKFKPYKKRKK